MILGTRIWVRVEMPHLGVFFFGNYKTIKTHDSTTREYRLSLLFLESRQSFSTTQRESERGCR